MSDTIRFRAISMVVLCVVLGIILGLLITVTAQAQSNTCNNGDALVVNTAGSKNNQCIPLNQQPAGTGTTMIVANAGITGTTLNKFAKLAGAPSTAVISSNGDTDGAIGVVTAGAGTTGNATITIMGQVGCIFDGATVANDYVTIAASGGGCHSAGSTYPTGSTVYGRVLSTNGGAGTYVMELMTPDITGSAATSSNGKSKPGGSNTQVQFNDSNAFGGVAQFIWNKTTQKLTIGGSGAASGSLTVQDNTGRSLDLGWNGASQVVTANGLELDLAGGDIYMYTGGGPSNRWRFTSTGMFTPSGSDGGFDIGDSTHHVRSLYFTNLISYSNKLTYSGGTPSIAGNATLNSGSKDSAGKLTSTGTGASTAVLTFGTAFSNAPACMVTNETTSNLVRPISTTTTLTINATVVTGDSISYICIGY